MPPSVSPQPAERQDGAAPTPVLVRLFRGETLESFHRGSFAIADTAGRIVAGLGDLDRPIFPRSAIKLIQAVPLVESRAADAFGLSQKELALACASHGGEQAHTEAVLAWLNRIGASEADLACGPHPPACPPAAEALIRAGRRPTRVHNNCSGKHTGFLTLARHLGAPLKGYETPDHPVQRAVAEALGALSGEDPASFALGIDGCGVPNFALPLSSLATAFARVADPSALAPERRAAIERLKAAVTAEPFYIAGTGRLCTRIIEAGADAIPKTGAEGVYVAALPGLKLGVALKIDDGSGLAAQCLLMALVVGLGALSPEAPLAREMTMQTVPNTQGRRAALRVADFDALAAVLAAFDPEALRTLAKARPQIEMP
jgi:L-asparaginase II